VFKKVAFLEGSPLFGGPAFWGSANQTFWKYSDRLEKCWSYKRPLCTYFSDT